VIELEVRHDDQCRVAERPRQCYDRAVADAEMRVVSETDVASAPGNPERFTGDVWQAEILDALRDDGLRGHRFVYGPGARSNWHVHTGEQAIVVLDGTGLVQWEGLDEPRLLRPGDWVHVLPGVPHWHGAAPDNVFVHLAVTASGTTQWGEVVR
jgi:quercetin dioxygenase-like cupin family protein